MNAVSFRRLYLNNAGPEHEASHEVLKTVIASMRQHAAGPDPFKVEVRRDDGSLVILSPGRGAQ